MGRKEDFDWLNDPFDERKEAREQARAAGSNTTKVVLACVGLVAIVGVVALLAFAVFGIADILGG